MSFANASQPGPGETDMGVGEKPVVAVWKILVLTSLLLWEQEFVYCVCVSLEPPEMQCLVSP